MSSLPRVTRHKNWRSWLARDQAWLFVLVGIACLAASVAATITAIHPHYPRVHDEFCNLLAADTLLHGRLANTTPAVWEPLQTYHVIFEPSYAAKYPLSNAILIATGILLFGAPIAGSWIAAGLCASSLTWMAAGVVSRRWATLSGLLVAFHPAMQCSWSQSLFGGWLTVAGAALLTGGVLRLRRRVSAASALTAGLGIATLALSRPFEGFVFTLVCSLLLLFSWKDGIVDRLRKAVQCICLALAPVAASLVLIALQNEAATGSYLQMPYQVHESQYGAAPLFVFGQAKTPEFLASGQMPDAVERYQMGWSLASYSNRRGFEGWLQGVSKSAWVTFGFWGLSFAFVPVALAPFVLRFRIGRRMLVAMLVQISASACVCWIFPHYLAPLLVWLFLFLTLGVRIGWGTLRRNVQESMSIRMAPRIVVLGQLALLCFAVMQLASRSQNTWAKHRAEVAEWLAMQSGQHLVIVEYDPDHNVHQEWVYNLADVDQAKVLWARGERDEWQQELLAHYRESHQIWTFNPDQQTRPTPLLPAKRGAESNQVAVDHSAGRKSH